MTVFAKCTTFVLLRLALLIMCQTLVLNLVCLKAIFFLLQYVWSINRAPDRKIQGTPISNLLDMQELTIYLRYTNARL